MKPPRLGSLQDRVLQDYFLQEQTKEILFSSFLCNILSILAESKSTEPKAARAEITGKWKNYVAVVLGAENMIANQEQDMMDEYMALWKNTQVTLKKDNRGNLSVDIVVPKTKPKAK